MKQKSIKAANGFYLVVSLTQTLGFIGAVITAVAYVPQVKQLVFEKCSYAISVKAWLLWLVATLLVSVHAFTTNDSVFMALQTINAAAIITIIFLAIKYKGKTCTTCKPGKKFKH